MTNTIEKHVHIAAPVERVWRALTDSREFGQWFRVNIDTPFMEGLAASGQMTVPGYEHLQWKVTVVAIEPMRRFAFTWHPYAVDPAVDYSVEEPTLVEFTITPENDGTRLTVTESGFDRVPAARRAEALRMNEGGWSKQMENIRHHVEA